VRQDLLKRYVWWFNVLIVMVNVILTALCCLDTQNVAVPVFAFIIIMPVLLQFSGGVIYMYLVAPLKGLFASRKDKDENYNALFEERFNARVKKKKKNSGDEEAAPGSSHQSKPTATRFIRRANSMDQKKVSAKHTRTEIIEEEIDSDEEAELQRQFQQTLLADLSKTNATPSTNGKRQLDSIRAKLKTDGMVPANTHSRNSPLPNPTIGMVEKPAHHKGRRGGSPVL
jgi:hypothetical protein